MYLAKLLVEPFSSGSVVELFMDDCGLGDVGARILVGMNPLVYACACLCAVHDGMSWRAHAL